VELEEVVLQLMKRAVVVVVVVVVGIAPVPE